MNYGIYGKSFISLCSLYLHTVYNLARRANDTNFPI